MIAGAPRPRPPSREVRLRAAVPHDRARVLAWNGDREVRARSLDPRPIDAVNHARWFAARLADPLTAMWIVEIDRSPVGLVRLQRAGFEAPARISIVIDRDTRGRGVGRDAIRVACQRDRGPVVAEILADNPGSITCFAAAGFTPLAEHDEVALALGPAAAGVRRFVWRDQP